jgi:Holliday junction resolvase RusA-like endonuclease
MNINFTVLGEPQGKGRPRANVICKKNGAPVINPKTGRPIINERTPDKTVVYENLIKTEYRRQVGNERFPDDAMLSINVAAYYGIPASASKRKKQGMELGAVRPTKKPDADNILKVVADSLNQVAYRDDAQIVTAIVSKYYSYRPRLDISIQIQKFIQEG